MVNHLVVPLALAGLQIDADDALGEEVVTGTMAAVVIGSRRFDRQIHEAEFLVDRDLCPDAVVAIGSPRVSFPRIAAELAGARNGVERPEQLTASDIERADQALRVVVRTDGCALPERRPDDRDVLDDRWRRVQANLSGLEIDRQAVAEHRALLQ